MRPHAPRSPAAAIAAATLACLFTPAVQALDLPLAGDTTLNANLPNASFGAVPNLSIGAGSAALLRFDLGSLPSGTTAAQVSKATLVLYVNRVGSAGAVEVQTVLGTWSEATTTSATAPITAGAGTGPQAAVTAAGQFVAVDVTADRASELGLTNGLPIRLRVERQLGYKQTKFIHTIELTDSLLSFGAGKGSYWADRGYEWYAGI